MLVPSYYKHCIVSIAGYCWSTIDWSHSCVLTASFASCSCAQLDMISESIHLSDVACCVWRYDSLEQCLIGMIGLLLWGAEVHNFLFENKAHTPCHGSPSKQVWLDVIVSCNNHAFLNVKGQECQTKQKHTQCSMLSMDTVRCYKHEIVSYQEYNVYSCSYPASSMRKVGL